jgi:histone arginine demethylase JMJD6
MDIERRSGLTRSNFVHEFVRPNRPVIFTDLSKGWPARDTFTFDFFRKHYADVPLDVRGRRVRLQEVLDRLENDEELSDFYPCKLNLRDEHLTEIARMVEPRPEPICPDRTNHPLVPRRLLEGLFDLEIFFGGKGGEFPYLHYDYLGLYAIINQLYGEKEFTLFSPDQQEYLYPAEGKPWISRIRNHHAVDLEEFPLFRHATPINVVLKPGESLFIPKKWYHTARSLSPTISVAMDQLCHFNWNHFTRESLLGRSNRPIKHVLLRSYLGA